MEKKFAGLLEKWSMLGADFEIKLFCYMSSCVHFMLFLLTFWRSTYFAAYQILVVIMYGIMGARFVKKNFILYYIGILCEIVGHAVIVWLFAGDTCDAEQYIVFLIIIMSYSVFFVDSFWVRMSFALGSMLFSVVTYFWLSHVLRVFLPPIYIEKMWDIQGVLTIFFSMSTLVFLFVWVFIQSMRNHIQVEKLKEDNNRLKLSNDMDFLTGVYSRKYAQIVLDKRYDRYCETGKIFSVAIGDIDFFKTVNDKYGHEAGDVVLKSFGSLFMKCIRQKDVVSRWGGEEFLFVFEADLDSVVEVLERLRQLIEKTSVPIRNGEVSVTMTFGCAQIKPGETVLELVHRADSYLYWGKKAGRNQVVTSKSLEEDEVSQGL